MKRLSEEEKRQLGYLIHHYRNLYFHSNATNANEFKQTLFCKNICSQTQLSRLENGDVLKDQDIYFQFLNKLKLNLEKIPVKDQAIFNTYFENIITYQNDDSLVINYNDYVLQINSFQNIFKKNIIYTHYNYALEFILGILNDDLDEVSNLIEDVESNLDILPTKYLVVTLHYLGNYYYLINNYLKANKFYLLSIEHMHKNSINNSIIYLDTAINYIKMNKSIYVLDYLHKALDVFTGTHNYEILAKIYYFYGLVNLKNKYIDDGINHLYKSIKFSKKVNKYELLNSTYNLISIGYYLNGNFNKAFHFIKDVNLIESTEETSLIKLILHVKNGLKIDNKEFSGEALNLIKNLFMTKDDKETYFEKNIEHHLNDYSDTIKLLIINEMYYLYKENKKYKKALDHIEKYIL